MKQDNRNTTRVDRGWTRMSTVLDSEMPEKKKRRRSLWLFFFGGLIAAFSIWMYTSQIPINEVISPNEDVLVQKADKSSTFEMRDLNKMGKETRTQEVSKSDSDSNQETDIKSKRSITETVATKRVQATKPVIKKTRTAQPNIVSEEIKTRPIKEDAMKKVLVADLRPNINNTSPDKFLYTQLLPTKDGLVVKKESLSKSIFELAKIEGIALDRLETKRMLGSEAPPPIFKTDVINESEALKFYPFASLGVGGNYLPSIQGIGVSPSIDLGLTNSKFAFGLSIVYNHHWTSYFTDRNYYLDQNQRLISEDEFIISAAQNAPNTFSSDPVSLGTNKVGFLSTGIFASYLINSSFKLRVGLGMDYRYRLELLGNDQDALQEDIPSGGTAGGDTQTNGTMEDNEGAPEEFGSGVTTNSSSPYSEFVLTYQVKDKLGISAGYTHAFRPFYQLENLSFNASRVRLGLNWRF